MVFLLNISMNVEINAVICVAVFLLTLQSLVRQDDRSQGLDCITACIESANHGMAEIAGRVRCR